VPALQAVPQERRPAVLAGLQRRVEPARGQDPQVSAALSGGVADARDSLLLHSFTAAVQHIVSYPGLSALYVW